DDVRAYEGEIGFTLPPEYRWLLQQTNGGRPVPNRLPGDLFPRDEYKDEEEDETVEDQAESEGYDTKVTFFPLRQGSAPAPVAEEAEEVFAGYSVEEARGWYHDSSSIPRGMLPIGNLSGCGLEGSAFLLLGCKGKDRGKLFVFDHSPARLGFDLP